VVINGRKLALFNLGGNIYAIEDTCPHRGAPLSEGECDGTTVICPWHGASFDLTSGAVLSPPASSGVMAFKVQLVGNEVQIDLP
jgi:nitrite reductase/ring-hydroxylating ferredoxin subunit